MAVFRLAAFSQARLPGFFAWQCLALLLPVLIVLATKSAPLSLAIAAVVAVFELVRLPDWRMQLRSQLTSMVRRSDVILALVALVVMLFSIPMAHRVGSSVNQLSQMLAPLAATAILMAVLPIFHVQQRKIFTALAVGLGVATLLLVVDIFAGLPLQKVLGARATVYAYNRTIVVLSLLAWPLFAYFWLNGPKLLCLIPALVLVPVFIGDSGAAALGILLSVIICGLAFLAPRIVRLAGLVLVLLGLVVAPFAGSVLGKVMTPHWHEVLKGAHTQHRVEILQAYEAMLNKSRVMGHGFGASMDINLSPVARTLPAELQFGLTSLHPHNAFMQIWVELGLIGASIAAVLLTMLFIGIGRAPKRLQPFLLGWVAGILGIALVSHGAWQAWWIAAIAASALFFRSIAGDANTHRIST